MVSALSHERTIMGSNPHPPNFTASEVNRKITMSYKTAFLARGTYVANAGNCSTILGICKVKLSA